MSTTIQSGDGQGYAAKVSEDGLLATETQASPHGVYRSSVNVTATSGTLVAARAGRRGIWVQNQGANPAYLRFDSSAALVTDWSIAAGGEFRSDSFAYEGEIRAISVGAGTTVLVLESA